MNHRDALRALKALAQGRRLAAFRALVAAGPDGLPVGELRELIDLPPATLTAQLNLLRSAGLVLDERQGRVIRVSADFARMAALLDYLTENCCGGMSSCGPKMVCKPAKTKSRSRR